MEKIQQKCMFLCFHVNFKHESTKTCMLPCNFYIAPPSQSLLEVLQLTNTGWRPGNEAIG